MSKDKTAPAEVGIDEIELPPAEAVDKMLDEPAADVSQAAKPQGPAPEVAELDFEIVPAEFIPLDYPFTHDGKRIDGIAVTRLTIGRVAELVADYSNKPFDNFEIYAEMAGLPAPVLRGLVDVDGDRFTEVAYDFLPRVFRPASEPPSSGDL
ncbi:MAG: hypothetical protein AAF141_02755 [Pseudomonadota bacterium]